MSYMIDSCVFEAHWTALSPAPNAYIHVDTSEAQTDEDVLLTGIFEVN